MAFTSSHFELRVRDLAAARQFYVEQLGLPILQDTPAMKLLAVQAGGVRLSIFGNRSDDGGPGPAQIILATDNLDDAIADLAGRGLTPDGPPVAAGGFLRFVTVRDPDGNTVAISEYFRDPLTAV